MTHLLQVRLADEKIHLSRYDRLLSRLEDAEPALRRVLPQLEKQRDEEADHVGWLAGQLEELGVTTGGGEDALLREPDDEPLSATFQALLAGELREESDWKVLVSLAETVGDEPAREIFAGCHGQAEEHVRFLRRTLVELLRSDLFGMAVTLPVSP